MDLKDFIEHTLEECKHRMLRTMDGLTLAEINWRPNAQSNSIAFIVWHTARVEDRWTMRFGQGLTDVWVRDAWFERFGLAKADTGVGYTLEELARFPALSQDELCGYFDAVRVETVIFLRDLFPEEMYKSPGRPPFDDPPRRSSFGQDFNIARMYRQLIGEENRHLGQAAYLRGLQRGLNG